MTDTIFSDLARRVFSEAAAAPAGGFDDGLWRQVEAAGLDRLLLPEEEGGAGDAFGEAVSVMIAFGGSAAAVPFADTLVANWCLAKAGLAIPAGPKALLFAPDVQDAAGAGEAAYWLSAVAHAVVVDAARGEAALVRTGGTGDVAQTLSGEPVSFLADRSALAVEAEGQLSVSTQQALALAATLEAAAIVGGLERIQGLSVDYANTRRQFGRAIARFQAVQLLAVRLASETAAARAAVEHAAVALSGPAPLFAAGVAKARASEAAGKAAADAHQIHGAIGFTREYELHRHTTRLWTWRERRGNERYWNGRIGAAAVAGGASRLWSGLVDGFEL